MIKLGFGTSILNKVKWEGKIDGIGTYAAELFDQLSNFKKDIEIHRGVVMNPFSHYDLEKPEFQTELQQTIDSVEKLNGQIATIKKNQSIDKLKKEVEELNKAIVGRDKTISEMGIKLKAK